MAKHSSNKLLEGALQHSAELKAFLLKRTGERHVAEDVFQDLIVRFLEKGKTYYPKNVKSYLFSAAANAVTDWARKQKRRERGAKDLASWRNEGASVDTEMEGSLAARQELEAVAKALNELPPRTRKIFRLVRIEGKTHKEAAEVLGLSVRTIERNLAKALTHCLSRLRK